jgi:hypothetical protein
MNMNDSTSALIASSHRPCYSETLIETTVREERATDIPLTVQTGLRLEKHARWRLGLADKGD